MRTLLKGGSLVSGSGVRRADILVDGEKIAAVGRHLQKEADQTVDVSHCLLFPGFIDAHTHFDLDTAGTATADGFLAGSRAALLGGTTTVIDYVYPHSGEGLEQGLALWHQKADGKTFCDYGFHMTIGSWSASVQAELPEMFAKGVSSFRMDMTVPDGMGDGEMYLVLKELRRLGGLCGVHCENAGVVGAITARRRAAGELSPASHLLARPSCLEAEGVSRLLRIAQAADCPVVILHLTCRESLEEAERARRRGQIVYGETCPQYLLLDQRVYFGQDGARYVCVPPLRDKEEHSALWRALRRGEIQIVSTDHRAFTMAQKDQKDFTKIPEGLPGVETRGRLIYTEGVVNRRLGLTDMCRILAENPAKLYGLFPRKGILQPGSDADIVVYDPKGSHTIRAEDCAAEGGYSPYEGFETAGIIRQVWLRGTLSAENGAVLAETPQGRYMARGRRRLQQS